MINRYPTTDLIKNVPLWFAIRKAINESKNVNRATAGRFCINTYRGMLHDEYIESSTYFPNHLHTYDGRGKDLCLSFQFVDKFHISMHWKAQDLHWHTMVENESMSVDLSSLLHFPHSYQMDYECFVDPALVNMSLFVFDGLTCADVEADLVVLRLKMET